MLRSVATIAGMLLISLAYQGGATVQSSAGPEIAQPPSPPPTLKTIRSHTGRVISVGKQSLTLQGLDLLVGGSEWYYSGRKGTLHVGKRVVLYQWKDDVSNLTTPVATGSIAVFSQDAVRVLAADGKITTLTRAVSPLVKFHASAALAAGGYCCDKGESFSYRLWDVRVGDEVEVEGHSYDGAWRCVAIKILARPGGRVPPSELADKSTLPAWHPRWHVTANAYQDWRERGIPLPKDPLPDHPRRPLPLEREPVGPERPKLPLLPGDVFPDSPVNPIGDD